MRKFILMLAVTSLLFSCNQAEVQEEVQEEATESEVLVEVQEEVVVEDTLKVEELVEAE